MKLAQPTNLLSLWVAAASLSLFMMTRTANAAAGGSTPDSCNGVAEDACYVERCRNAYISSGYTRLATTSFDSWYNQDSELEFAPAGVYRGPDGIAEYIDLFINQAFFLGTDKVNSVELEVLEAKKNKCVIRVADHERSVYNGCGIPPLGVPPVTNGEIMDFIAGQKIQFQVRGSAEDEILIKTNYLYLPKQFPFILLLRAIPENIVPFFCNFIFLSNCAPTWAVKGDPGASTPEECIASFTALPPVEPSRDFQNVVIDSNSQGCRLLHGSFAITNDFHCPHISFLPMDDDNGESKCQTTRGRLMEDYFTQDDFDYFDAANDVFGIGSLDLAPFGVPVVVDGVAVSTPDYCTGFPCCPPSP